MTSTKHVCGTVSVGPHAIEGILQPLLACDERRERLPMSLIPGAAAPDLTIGVTAPLATSSADTPASVPSASDPVK